KTQSSVTVSRLARGGDSVCAPSAPVIRIVERHVDLEIAHREIAAEVLRHAAAIAADSAAAAPVGARNSDLEITDRPPPARLEEIRTRISSGAARRDLPW